MKYPEDVPFHGKDQVLVQSLPRLTPEMQRSLMESEALAKLRDYMAQHPYEAPSPAFALSEICSISGDAVGKLFQSTSNDNTAVKELLLRQAALAIQTYLHI